MKLLIDIGNTRIKWAYWSKGRLSRVQHFHYRWPFMESYWGDVLPSSVYPESVSVANVGCREINASLAQWNARHWGCPLRFFESDISAHGVVNGYGDPSRLGIDRWAAMIAAYDLCKGSVCVVDFGTAVTLDIVRADGQHEGGLILPGHKIMRQGLSADTSRIEITASQPKYALLGNDTLSCIDSASLQATLGMIERTVGDYGQLRGESLECLITGGDAPLYMPQLRIPYRYEQDLVLMGLGLKSEEDR